MIFRLWKEETLILLFLLPTFLLPRLVNFGSVCSCDFNVIITFKNAMKKFVRKLLSSYMKTLCLLLLRYILILNYYHWCWCIYFSFGYMTKLFIQMKWVVPLKCVVEWNVLLHNMFSFYLYLGWLISVVLLVWIVRKALTFNGVQLFSCEWAWLLFLLKMYTVT